ncbi:uncharacterized protein BCR38DRAFT_293526, partial [Pseudomassariella vexata]
RPKVGRVPYGVEIEECTSKGKVALTFDDGPAEFTNDLLDTLKENGVMATFFITGANGDNGEIQDHWGDVIQRMHKDWHHIASHGWSHRDMDGLSSDEREEEVFENEKALAEILGSFPTYFRPPYGTCASECLHDLGRLGYHVVMWNLDTEDWKGDYDHARSFYETCLGEEGPDSKSWISLAHDPQPETVKSFAQYMIDVANKYGYELVTLGECLEDPRHNWYRN